MVVYLLIAWLLICSVACTVMAVVAISQRNTPSGRVFGGAMLSVAVYAFGYGMELTATTLEQAMAYIRLEYLGAAMVPAFWMLLAINYSTSGKWLKFPRMLIFFVIPIIVLSTVFTNGIHHMFYTSARLIQAGNIYLLSFGKGIFYWIHVGYGFFSFIFSTILLSKGLVLQQAIFRKQTGIMLGAGLVAISVYVLYQAGLQPIANLDMIVIALTFSALIIGWGYFRYKLVELPPFAREILFEKLSDAVFVLDAEDRLIDYNKSALPFVQNPQNAVGRSFYQAVQAELGEQIRNIQAANRLIEVKLHHLAAGYYELAIEPLAGENQETIGKLIVLHDATERKKAQLALLALNEALEQRVNERTLEAQRTIEELGREIVQRKEAEARLQELQESLMNKVAVQSRKLNSLYDVLLYRDQNLNYQTIMEQSLKVIQEMMTADAVCFNEHWKDENLHLVAEVGLTEMQLPLLNVLPSGWERTDFPLMSSALESDENVPEGLRRTGYVTCLAAPVNLNRQNLGVILAFWKKSEPLAVEDISMFAIIAEQLGIIMENTRLRGAIEERAAMLERRRLARDLHDSVTQSLHGLLLNADVLRHRMEQAKYERAVETIEQIDTNARQALKEIRLMLYELRITPLDEVHLVEALKTRIEAVEQKAGIDAVIRVGKPANWPAAWETELYPIAMEAMNNSLKYAQATYLEVRLRGDADWVVMEVEDNGRGFDRQDTHPRGWGMHTMRERAERLGGTLEVASKRGEGTRIRVAVGLED